MSEDQERFEDYIELENYIETLQAGKVAASPENLPREQARIYEMAALFQSATDDDIENSATFEDIEPRPEFAEQLQNRLLNAMRDQQMSEGISSDKRPLSPESTESATKQKATPKLVHFFSRRNLLTSGAITAASLVIGAGIGYEAEKNQKTETSVTPPTSNGETTGQQLHISTGIPTRWHFVTMLNDLGNTAVRFTSDSIVGYVIRTTNTTETNNNEDKIIALSASCTHKGCLVQWKNTERQFSCPCHGAIFDHLGTQIQNGYLYKLAPLPSLNTKIEQGNVYVEVPL